MRSQPIFGAMLAVGLGMVARPGPPEGAGKDPRDLSPEAFIEAEKRKAAFERRQAEGKRVGRVSQERTRALSAPTPADLERQRRAQERQARKVARQAKGFVTPSERA